MVRTTGGTGCVIVGGAAGTGMANVCPWALTTWPASPLQLPLRRGQTHLGLGEDGLGLDLRQFANGASAGLAGREERKSTAMPIGSVRIDFSCDSPVQLAVLERGFEVGDADTGGGPLEGQVCREPGLGAEGEFLPGRQHNLLFSRSFRAGRGGLSPG